MISDFHLVVIITLQSNEQMLSENEVLREKIVNLREGEWLKSLKTVCNEPEEPLLSGAIHPDSIIHRKRASSFSIPKTHGAGNGPKAKSGPVQHLRALKTKVAELETKSNGSQSDLIVELHEMCNELECMLKSDEKQARPLVDMPRLAEMKNENKLLLDQMALVKEALERAEMELEIYRTEPREEARARQANEKLQKSRSLVELDTATATPQELKR